MHLYDLHLNLHLKIHNLPKTLILADLDRDQYVSLLAISLEIRAADVACSRSESMLLASLCNFGTL